MTTERPAAHILPRAVLGSYRIESVVSAYVAMSVLLPMPSLPCLVERSPTSHSAWSAHEV
eukprot:scaffold62940_cov83-Phaeocystis_antarctica.AAC.1